MTNNFIRREIQRQLERGEKDFQSKNGRQGATVFVPQRGIMLIAIAAKENIKLPRSGIV
jgi:hypothetical protein